VSCADAICSSKNVLQLRQLAEVYLKLLDRR